MGAGRKVRPFFMPGWIQGFKMVAVGEGVGRRFAPAWSRRSVALQRAVFSTMDMGIVAGVVGWVS
ncbi:MAG: hypothetical protein COX57_07645 [Alphaproteobacteria bacterium CG_4_10_14_0_2_um_filter_63_37]|nr:MAG: hypothetical protein AUJ55_04630 [Proteobacteria bacterium CG1_02_64_396]PJA24624.1 MAG: hypothetical protein COX57_07645 [Alphaproteobacteria bacterium CG_4_10_14_0_2_um_filter_63_37]